MAAGNTKIADIVVPEVFTPQTVLRTEEKSRIIRSGVAVRDSMLDGLLSGGGLTFDIPAFKPLDNEEENVSGDDEDDTFKDAWSGLTNSRPKKITSATEIAVRLSRNQSWSTADLTAALGTKDPMEAIKELVSDYWALRQQAAFVATMKGIFADNDAAPAGTEHTQYDLTNDVKGSTFVEGVTNFTSEAFLDAAVTMGDSMEDLGLILVHSIVYNRMQKNNLIDFIPDAINPNVNVPTFLGRTVIVDDGMPASGGVFQSWLFGRGAVRLGMGTPKVPTEVARYASAANGGGQEVLHNRVEWAIHPNGHKYAGTTSKGGPSNGTGSNQLANAGSWQRVYPERKQIKIARLVTREY